MEKTEKVTLGNSDYTKEQMESGDIGFTIGNQYEFLHRIKVYEDAGYTVEFRTSLLRRIFCTGTYKVVAVK